MLIHNAEVTGSLRINNVPFNSGSFSGSFRGDGSQLTGVTGASTASYVEYSNVANKPALVSSSAQIVGYGIFATTGSNQFNGSQAITGSLTVTGQVVAQTLNVQQVTSSIVYSSGSNVFGNSQSNTQQFTGSVSVTGSLTVTTTGTELQVTSTGVNLGNIVTDNHNVTGSLRVSGSMALNGAGTFSNNITSTLSSGIFLNNSSGGTNATQIRINNTGGDARFGVESSTGGTIQVGTSAYAAVFGNQANAATQFTTNGTLRMTITSDGNVGIGTAPDSKFEIRGSTSSPQFRISRSEQTNQGLTIQAGGGVTVFDSYDGTDTVFGSYTFNSTKGTNTVTRMRIDGSGNVGIGTTSLSGTYEKLAVAGGISIKNDNNAKLEIGRYSVGVPNSYIKLGTSSNSLIVTNNTDTADIIAIQNAGNVGIGTTSPTVPLHLRDSTNGFVGLRLEGSGTYAGSDWIIYASSSTPSSANDFLGFYNNSATDGATADYKLRIFKNGNIIIGPPSVVDLGSIMTVDGNINLTNGANRFIYIGSATNYNYRLRTDGDDFAIREADSTDRLRYSYTNVRWDITGGLAVSGALSKGSGSFRIDHPLPSKKDTHHLVHSFIEGPQADNIYRGKIQLVNGKATINLDQAARMTEGTFILLNGNTQCFTSNESGWTAVKGIVEENILTIEAQDPECTNTISWLVVGERIDQHMLDTDWTDENGKVIVEPLKTE
jgi:hypothetical protein